jgi:5-formyltetrahydrofolate cyclo-ligase
MKKQALRELVWNELERHGLTTFPRPAHERIPNFVGSEKAAAKLRSIPAYRKAKIIMVNPDAAQLAVRELALLDGKKLLMASPRLRKGFILLDPAKIRNPREAASIRGAFRHGMPIDIRGIKVDLIVEGSVAVDTKGGRLGKGGGFGDLEYAILRESSAASESTPIATTVHQLQIIESVPMTEHDVPVDFIVAPDRVIETEHKYKKPQRIFWELLPQKALKMMPILAEVKKR